MPIKNLLSGLALWVKRLNLEKLRSVVSIPLVESNIVRRMLRLKLILRRFRPLCL